MRSTSSRARMKAGEAKPLAPPIVSQAAATHLKCVAAEHVADAVKAVAPVAVGVWRACQRRQYLNAVQVEPLLQRCEFSRQALENFLTGTTNVERTPLRHSITPCACKHPLPVSTHLCSPAAHRSGQRWKAATAGVAKFAQQGLVNLCVVEGMSFGAAPGEKDSRASRAPPPRGLAPL